MESKYFSLEDVSIGYNTKKPILKNVNLTFKMGQMIAVIGSNGSGKTTLVKTIVGLIPQLSGLKQIPNTTKMSLVPQIKDLKLGFPLTVEAALNLSSGFKIFQSNKVAKEKFANEILERIGIHHYKNLLIRECSGGQLQKYLIARSLISGSNCIFLDEPLDALDEGSQKGIFYLLNDLSTKENFSFFVITHHLAKDWLSNFSKIYQIRESELV
ncbi:MAG: ATP-binding cassette domain-containing protein [Leptospiraceae bacterium]|nr:ATP-binding cassette domain-containing protein [Leptospiraceae bacterium]MCZ8346888.1 ATP-binding cassette domain-containing protein [Leptospiraceae bacterium]